MSLICKLTMLPKGWQIQYLSIPSTHIQIEKTSAVPLYSIYHVYSYIMCVYMHLASTRNRWYISVVADPQVESSWFTIPRSLFLSILLFPSNKAWNSGVVYVFPHHLLMVLRLESVGGVMIIARTPNTFKGNSSKSQTKTRILIPQ